jgi:hypothetical protein
MRPSQGIIPELDHDPVFHLLLTGQAQTAAEAEEMYLNASLPEVIRLLQSPLSDEELGRHPVLVDVGLTVLVMGGHAVRYHGLERLTIDYDLHLSPSDWDGLVARLNQSPQYKLAMQNADAADTQALRATQVNREASP